MFVIKDFFYWGKMTQAEITPVEFVDLLGFADYEILNRYPFTIRRKDNKKVVSEWNTDGYLRVRLNGKNYFKHRLIAEQFIPNPNNYTEIDHINHNKTDYHLSNLRWISRSDNNRNRTLYNGITARYVDEIDSEALVCDYYETRTERYLFRDYYYHDGVFYYDTGANYRVLNINSTRSDSPYVWMYDTDGNRIKVYINRFLDQHDML